MYFRIVKTLLECARARNVLVRISRTFLSEFDSFTYNPSYSYMSLFTESSKTAFFTNIGYKLRMCLFHSHKCFVDKRLSSSFQVRKTWNLPVEIVSTFRFCKYQPKRSNIVFVLLVLEFCTHTNIYHTSELRSMHWSSCSREKITCAVCVVSQTSTLSESERKFMRKCDVGFVVADSVVCQESQYSCRFHQFHK